MAANFWLSSHYEEWIFDRVEIDRMQAEHLKIYTEQEYGKFHIFWANLITAIATDPVHHMSKQFNNPKSTATGHKVRQQVVATAVMYFKRFYVKYTFNDVNPFLLACTALYLACRVEEHTVMTITRCLRSCADQMQKRWGVSFDCDMSKAPEVFEAEVILVEALDCSLIVYHPFRCFNFLLPELKKKLKTCDEFENIVSQCHKVCNDTLRCDVGLQFAPFCIAYASMIVGIELMDKGTVDSNDFASFIVESAIDMEILQDCVAQIFKMYTLWQGFDEKTEVKMLVEKLPAITPSPVPPKPKPENVSLRPLVEMEQCPVEVGDMNFVPQQYIPELYRSVPYSLNVRTENQLF